jgi:HSP20 family protein
MQNRCVVAVPERSSRAVVDPFAAASRDLEAFARRVFGGETSTFPVDIFEDADKLHVHANLPGFAKEQVEITVDQNVLTITADRSSDAQAEPAREWLVRERRSTRLQRSFALPGTVDESTVSARLDAGVLHLTIDKRVEAKPRKIAIN